MKVLKLIDFFRYKKLLIFFFLLIGCAKTDSTTGEKILIEPNPEKRAEAARDKGGGFFGEITGKRSGTGNSYEFSTSNVLWRATLKSLDFLPILNADYSGGIIIYDWYSENINSNEYIKVSIRFLNNEVRSESLLITAHKKICNSKEQCQTSRLGDNFSKEIKNTILNEARLIKISETKK